MERSAFVRPGPEPGTVVLRCLVPKADGSPCGNEYLQETSAKRYWGACSPACYGRKAQNQKEAARLSALSRAEVKRDEVKRDPVMRRGYRLGRRRGVQIVLDGLRWVIRMAGRVA